MTMTIAPVTPTIIVVRGIPFTGTVTGAGGTVCIAVGAIVADEDDALIPDVTTVVTVVGTEVLVPIFVPPFWYAIAKYEKPGVVAR